MQCPQTATFYILCPSCRKRYQASHIYKTIGKIIFKIGDKKTKDSELNCVIFTATTERSTQKQYSCLRTVALMGPVVKLHLMQTRSGTHAHSVELHCRSNAVHRKKC
jgi:hypothetical protein